MNKTLVAGWKLFNKFFESLTPLGDLFIRIWVGKAFFASGLVKIQSWDSTLLLFQYEYETPFLSPDIAAVLSTSIELAMPVLLILGIGGRIPTLILFLFNIMAVVSYPFLWTAAGYVGLKDHICWGILLMVLLLHGVGKLSCDYFFVKWYKKSRQS